MYSSKLVVLRGNSGSGKSTVAKKLRESSQRKIVVIEQDYFRRFILKEKETQGTDNIGLISQIVTFALERGYDVILEGILTFHRYDALLKSFKEICPDNHFFYFDVSFEETLRRHASKPNAREFGEKEMREWYKPHDVTGFEGETVIPETVSIEDAVTLILDRSDL